MVIDADTLVAITPDQLVKINVAISRLDYLEDSNDVLKQELTVADSVNVTLNKMLALKDTVIYNTTEKLLYAEELNKDLHDHLLADKKRNLKTTIGVGVGGILLGLVTGLLLVK